MVPTDTAGALPERYAKVTSNNANATICMTHDLKENHKKQTNKCDKQVLLTCSKASPTVAVDGIVLDHTLCWL